MKAYKVIDGVVIIDDKGIAGQALIFEKDGVRQLHSDNFRLSKVSAIREVKKLVKNTKNLYTACYHNKENDCKLIESLGFKFITIKDGFSVYRKE